MGKFSIILSLSMAFLLTACGFQLRGKVTLPEGVEPLYIGGLSSNSQLGIELRNLLTASGVALTTESTTANYQLLVLEQDHDRRNASLGEGARAAEYLLIEEVTFALRNQQGERVLGPNKITERKIMPNDPNKVVSTAEEEKLLRREMLQRMAAKIARQLTAFKYQPAPVADN